MGSLLSCPITTGLSKEVLQVAFRRKGVKAGCWHQSSLEAVYNIEPKALHHFPVAETIDVLLFVMVFMVNPSNELDSTFLGARVFFLLGLSIYSREKLRRLALCSDKLDKYCVESTRRSHTRHETCVGKAVDGIDPRC